MATVRHFLLALLLVSVPSAAFAQAPDTPGSYLHDAVYCLDYEFHGKTRAYLPQPGDIMLATDKNWFWKVTHDMAFAFEPHNSAIVVAKPDGSLGILEAGPNDTMRIRTLDMLEHLREYEAKGPVWIRARKTPLTKEQNDALTDFAAKQEMKFFALQRLGVLLTPFRDRGPLRTYFMGKPNPNRCTYYCAELVVNAGVAAGIMDCKTSRPSATFPHDLFYDKSYNLYLSRHFNLSCDWDPPARWVSTPSK
jgi:hypothetical protein